MDTAKLMSQNFANGVVQTRNSKASYPVNCWWVAALPEEVTRKPISRWLLEQPVTMFRTSCGVITALEDRCAHRWAPLSQGRLLGDEIACPYHGFRYNTRGQCTHVPTQSHVPSALKVRAYPVREYGPFVWIWMGDPSRADPSLLPEISWSIDPADVRFGEHAEAHCDYAAVQENLMDLAHAPYLHGAADADWLQFSAATELLSTTVDVTDRGLCRVTKLSDTLPSSSDAMTMGFDAEKRVNFVHSVIFMPPGCFFQEHENEDPAPKRGARARYGYRGLHCTTPISAKRCHWWWAYTYNYGHEISREFKAFWDRILKQDKDLLEAIQMTVEQDIRGDEAPEVLVVADRALGEVRRMLREMIEAESPTARAMK